MLDGIIPLAMIGQVQKQVAALGSGFEVKGIVATTESLPATGELGDLYMVSSENYASYVWDDDNQAWERKGNIYGNIVNFNVTTVTL